MKSMNADAMIFLEKFMSFRTCLALAIAADHLAADEVNPASVSLPICNPPRETE